MSAVNRYYVEKVSDIDPDQNTGTVKITFAVEGKNGGDVVQIIAPVGKLNEMFHQVGETMQARFGGGSGPRAGGPGAGPHTGPGMRGGGAGGRPGGKGGAGGPPKFKDLTE